MEKTHISFTKAGFSKLITDYLSGSQSLKDFYEYAPTIESFKLAIEKKKKQTIDREALVEVLSAQYSTLDTQHSVINSLLDENTFTVTTGHQLNIFTGPLYFIYKILTTIKLTKILKDTYPQYNFVPVYWMASEDHDIEEINHISVYGKPVVWNTTQKGPAGRLSTADIGPVLEQLFALLGETDIHLKSAIETAYIKNANLADATRVLINELFGKYGLVIVNADDKRLKQAFTGIILEDITQKHSFRLVSETAAKLSEHYKVQVQPREINFFYIKDGLRERIVEEHGQYKVLNTTISLTENELRLAIETNPECFSPNVITRPLYQESILPNLAYVGGPAEIAYWMQYKLMFENYEVQYPLLVLRNCALWIDESLAGKIAKLGLKTEDLFTETNLLISDYIKRIATQNTDFDYEKNQIEQVFQAILNKICDVDITLRSTVEAEKSKALASINMLNDKSLKALKRKEQVTVNQIKSIKEKLFPGGALQERVDNFIPLYLKHGDTFFDTLLDGFNPLPHDFLVYHSATIPAS